MLRRVAAFCRPLRPVLPLVSFPRSRSPVVGVPGLCWLLSPPPLPPHLRRGAEVLEASKGPKKSFDWLKARRKIWSHLWNGPVPPVA